MFPFSCFILFVFFKIKCWGTPSDGSIGDGEVRAVGSEEVRRRLVGPEQSATLIDTAVPLAALER